MGMMENWLAVISNDPELPPDYRRVNWLHSDGNQRITITDTLHTGVDFTLTCQSDQTSDTGVILGYGAGGGRWFGVTGGKYAVATGERFSFNDIAITSKVDVTIRYTSGTIKATIGGTTVTGDIVGPQRSLTIFAGQGSSAWYSAPCKIYGLSASGVCNLVPCVRGSDDKPGFFDTVTKTFLTNSGTGEFTYG